MADVPLADVRVLDASRVLAGPFCGMILGDLGAEVIKVERPGQGDETRGWGPPFWNDLSAYFLSCNRNKKAITLDLAQPEGKRLLFELVRRCDVFLDNFLPSSAARLGVTAQQLHKENPRLIVCSITGFGQTGPWRDVPGYDFAIQAMSGLMSITGPVEGPPYKVGVAVSDVITGLYAAIGILACLHARQRTGHGYAIDLALLDCTLAAQVNVAQAYLTSGLVPPRQGNAHLQIVPYQLFETADGHIVLAVGNDHQWQRFCRAVRREDLAADPRFLTNTDRVRHRSELIPLLEPILKSRTTAAWQELLSAAEVPHSPVLTYDQVFAHPQCQSRGVRVTVHDPQGRPVDLLNTPFRIQGADLPSFTVPPRLGQDTEEILSRLLGLDAQTVDDLRRRGIV
ncbi:MAG: CoA transferase [Gemmatales bacterium]|nr:CoA transferase [Gemmatales bacterium]MDW8386127.1 CoA transferase [Gemmatales bacterium]